MKELLFLGAGPQTVAALKRLEESSAKLPPASDASAATAVTPKYVQPPPPSSDDQRTLLGEVRQYALNYSDSLPDFLCIQVTRRSVDPHYQSGGEPSWSPSDRIVERLSYFDKQEKYEAVPMNGKPALGKNRDALGGSISSGEFGSLLRDVFEPDTEAGFEWDHWGRWDEDLCYVFRYRIDRLHSRYSVDYEHRDKLSPAYHGLVYVRQKAPHVVIRLTIEPDVPGTFPMQDIHQAINYKYVEIGGNSYLLPANSSVQSRAGHVGNLNEIDFRQYRKYSADTKITFDDGDETPKKP